MNSLSAKPWNTEVSLEQIPGTMKSMIMWPEQKLLHWLTREYYSGQGVIGDLGCFVGSSTLSLISGLEARTEDRSLKRAPLVHSYDIFIAPDDEYTLDRLPENKKAGDSFREVFEGNLGDKVDWVSIHAGDLRKDPWKGGPIEILFIDICKCWSTNQAVLEMFYPSLIPGKSIVVQQDFVHAWCPWIPVSMSWLSDYFEVIAEEESSRIYLNTKSIPAELLSKPLRVFLSFEEKVELLRKSIDKSSPATAAIHEAAMSVLLFMEGDAVEALKHLESTKIKYASDATAQSVYDIVKWTMDCWKAGSAYEADMEKKF